MELITKDMIFLECEFQCKNDVIKQISETLLKEKRIRNKESYIEDVKERERTESTALGFSFAIPHAKSETVIIPSLVFIRLKKEIDWSEDEHAKNIFGIAVPNQGNNDIHLKILAKLSRKMIDSNFRKRLAESHTREEVLALLTSEND